MLREAFLGEICMVAFHFVPQGWMFCDGRLLNAQEHSSLYNLLGNTYMEVRKIKHLHYPICEDVCQSVQESD